MQAERSSRIAFVASTAASGSASSRKQRATVTQADLVTTRGTRHAVRAAPAPSAIEARILGATKCVPRCERKRRSSPRSWPASASANCPAQLASLPRRLWHQGRPKPSRNCPILGVVLRNSSGRYAPRICTSSQPSTWRYDNAHAQCETWLSAGPLRDAPRALPYLIGKFQCGG